MLETEARCGVHQIKLCARDASLGVTTTLLADNASESEASVETFDEKNESAVVSRGVGGVFCRAVNPVGKQNVGRDSGGVLLRLPL